MFAEHNNMPPRDGEVLKMFRCVQEMLHLTGVAADETYLLQRAQVLHISLWQKTNETLYA